VRVNPEKKEDRERVAQRLFRVTLSLAFAHGFVSLGLREVSRAADIAPTSFYRHFADMEELGRELIESLVGPFVDAIVTRARNGHAAEPLALRVAREAMASAVADPELARFIVAERVGAIPTFRAAVGEKLAALSLASRESVGAEGSDGAEGRTVVADAVVVLVLGACAELLDRGTQHAPAVTERLLLQIRCLLGSRAVGSGRP